MIVIVINDQGHNESGKTELELQAAQHLNFVTQQPGMCSVWRVYTKPRPRSFVHGGWDRLWCVRHQGAFAFAPRLTQPFSIVVRPSACGAQTNRGKLEASDGYNRVPASAGMPDKRM